MPLCHSTSLGPMCYFKCKLLYTNPLLFLRFVVPVLIYVVMSHLCWSIVCANKGASFPMCTCCHVLSCDLTSLLDTTSLLIGGQQPFQQVFVYYKNPLIIKRKCII